MKLRIQGNSLRLRLSEAEVTRFRESGVVAETLHFGPTPDQHLQYILARTGGIAALDVTFTGNRVMIRVPVAVAEDWVSTGQEGFSALIANGTAEGLKILVQKDQDCYHPTEGNLSSGNG